MSENVQNLKDLRELKGWVIGKAELAARLSEQFRHNPLEVKYAHGSLGAYHDVRVELDKLIDALEKKD